MNKNIRINELSNIDIHQTHFVSDIYNDLNSDRSQPVDTDQQNGLSNKNIEENIYVSQSISFHHPIQHILKTLKEQLRSNNYKCVEVFANSMLLVKMGVKQRLLALTGCSKPPRFLLKIHHDKCTSQRILNLFSLNNNVSLEKLNQLLNLVCSLIPDDPPKQKSNNEQYNYQDIYSLVPTSYYMYGKILLNKKYSIGKKLDTLVFITTKQNNLHSQGTSQGQEQQIESKNQTQYLDHDIQVMNRIQKHRMDWIMSCLNEIGEDMLTGFNCSRKQLTQILGFCHRSTYNYFFGMMNQNQANNTQINYAKQMMYGQQDILNNPTKKEFEKLSLAKSPEEIYLRMFKALWISKIQNKDNIDRMKTEYEQQLQTKLKIIKNSTIPKKEQEYIKQFLK